MTNSLIRDIVDAGLPQGPLEHAPVGLYKARRGHAVHSQPYCHRSKLKLNAHRGVLAQAPDTCDTCLDIWPASDSNAGYHQAASKLAAVCHLLDVKFTKDGSFHRGSHRPVVLTPGGLRRASSLLDQVDGLLKDFGTEAEPLTQCVNRVAGHLRTLQATEPSDAEKLPAVKELVYAKLDRPTFRDFDQAVAIEDTLGALSPVQVRQQGEMEGA
jgi:hypothetical protein